MWLLNALPTSDATRILLFAGGAAIVWSSVLGFIMLVPMQPWAPSLPRGMSFKHVGAAHLDWIVLGLMLGLAAAFLRSFGLSPSGSVVAALVTGAWLNPLPYVFRAFGINAFVLGGSALQRGAATLGLLSSLALLYAWTSLLVEAATVVLN